MIYDPNDASNADEAYDDWRQRHADEGTCHVCDGEGQVWVIGPWAGVWQNLALSYTWTGKRGFFFPTFVFTMRNLLICQTPTRHTSRG